ncbi:MAG: NADAR family protein [Deltaproteobacteria bacterium]|nr:NADAR family protein [Deltaproteobacteria bacterium]MBW2393308.1 NADAR family protein [Deltaproteobacteria bacterium]
MAGAKARYVFFWGHEPPQDGSISAVCFSQWYSAPFFEGETKYPTGENYMMAEKARIFGDLETREGILDSASPGEAKSLGRQPCRWHLGIGLDAADYRATDPQKWPGLNLLGFALMDVRARLAA